MVERLLEKSSLKTQADYFKQYAILKTLQKKYESKEFWCSVNFDTKLTSLYFFKTDYGSKILHKKYKEFIYKPPKKDAVFNLNYDKGKDIIVNKTIRTTKDFLND